MVAMVVMSVGVRVSGFSRRFDRRMVVMGGVGGVIVMRRMVVVAVVGGLDRRVAVVVVAVVIVMMGTMLIGRRGDRMVVMIRRVSRFMVAGVMRFGRVVRLVRAVCVVGLVFVAHVTPVPQPLTTVFDRETGIT